MHLRSGIRGGVITPNMERDMPEKIDYNKKMESQIEALGGARPDLLLHSCCAPCTSSVIERLHPYFHVTLYYYNPNTWPREEYEKRFLELPKLLRANGMTDVELIRAEYDENEFFDYIRGKEKEPEGGARCGGCFDLRLAGAAREAKRLGIRLFGTTLTVSPHKNAPLINEIGREKAADEGVDWLFADFKKKNGYLRSIELSKAYELYRQCYCGCSFSRAI